MPHSSKKFVAPTGLLRDLKINDLYEIRKTFCTKRLI